MKPGISILTVAALITLGACAPMGVRATNVKDFMLYGINERQLVFYGEESANVTALSVGAQSVTLAKASAVSNVAGLGVNGALQANDRASLAVPLSASIGQAISLGKSPLGPAVAVTARLPVNAVVYFDGANWLTVSGALKANVRVKATPATRVTLRGLGSLTDAEADGLAAYLVAKVKGPMGVAFLQDDASLDAAPTFDPTPRTYARVPLFIQQGVPVDALVDLAPDLNSSRRLAAGGNSGYSGQSPQVQLDRTADRFTSTWNLINSIMTPQPAQPSLNFGSETVVTIFLGQKPTGGYSLTLAGIKATRDALTVSVKVGAPRPGLIVTQSLTSPYLSLAVPGVFSSVQVVNADTGQVIATAP